MLKASSLFQIQILVIFTIDLNQKKKISFSLLLFACMVILVQGITPHHHHEDDTICVENNHCETDDLCNKSFPTHETDHQNRNDETCTFDLFILSIHANHNNNSVKTINLNQDFAWILFRENYFLLNQIKETLPFLVEINYPCYSIANDNRLRAPPVAIS